MNSKICSLGVFHIPFIRDGIAAVDKLHPLPLKDKTHCTVESVDSGNRATDHMVFVIDDFIDTVERKLVDLKFTATEINDT